MKSPVTSSLLADDGAPSGDQFHKANADGIYETAEAVIVPMGPGGNFCHLMVAHTPEGFIGGHKLFMRQPRNLAHNLPRAAGAKPVPTRWAALAGEIGIALRFFSDHKAALDHLYAWIETTLPDAELEAVRRLAKDIGLTAWAKKPPGIPTDPEALAVHRASHPAVDDLPVEPAGTAGDALAVPAATHAAEAAPASDASAVPPVARHAEIRVDAIERGSNPRKERDPVAQAELVESLRHAPLLHSIVVCDMGEGREGKPDTKRYRLIVGEGRWLAYQTLERETIEAKVFTGVDAATARAWALVENLQRSDMNAVDEAEGFAELSRLGWTPAKMAEQTGKTVRTIQRALRRMKLPDFIREMVRGGELSARQADALSRWVVSVGDDAGATAAGFVSRPAVAEIIGKVAAKSAGNISSDTLAEGIPQVAIPALLDGKALIEVNSAKYYEALSARGLFAFAPETGKYFRIGSGHGLYCWPETGWPALKKVIDKEARDEAEKRTERAATRVSAAATSGVNVPLSALKEAKAEHVILKGDLEIYAEYLPEECVSMGIDPATKAEVPVCTQPLKLQALRDAETKALTDDRAEKLPKLHEAATAKIRKIKRVGPREMAFLVERACSDGFSDPLITLCGQSFKLQGGKLPKNLTRAGLAGLEPIALLRVFLQASLGGYCGTKDELDHLRWILEVPKLGLIEEDARARTDLLSQLSLHLFGAALDAELPFEPTPPAAKGKAAAKKSSAKRPAKKARK